MQPLFELVFTFAIVIFVVGAIAEFAGGSRGGVPRVVGRPLMSRREIAFWHLLRRAAEPFHVAPQVAMNALITTESGLAKSRWRGSRNAFQSKVVDFALLDDSGAVRLLIELDDRSHAADCDAARDRMTARAGYRTLRVDGAEARDRRLLNHAIAAAFD